MPTLPLNTTFHAFSTLPKELQRVIIAYALINTPPFPHHHRNIHVPK
jgi:hypothetical protein